MGDGKRPLLHGLDTLTFRPRCRGGRRGEEGPRLRLREGELLSILKARGNEVCGVDYSAKAVAATRRRGIRAFVSKTLRTKFPKDSFDAVVSTEVIEHLVDTGAFIDECRRVLKPGGILVLSTPNLASASNRLKILAGTKPTFAEEELANSAGHLRLFTRGMLRSLLGRHSLTVERMLGSRTIIPGTQVQLPDPVTRALPQFS